MCVWSCELKPLWKPTSLIQAKQELNKKDSVGNEVLKLKFNTRLIAHNFETWQGKRKKLGDNNDNNGNNNS